MYCLFRFTSSTLLLCFHAQSNKLLERFKLKSKFMTAYFRCVLPAASCYEAALLINAWFSIHPFGTSQHKHFPIKKENFSPSPQSIPFCSKSDGIPALLSDASGGIQRCTCKKAQEFFWNSSIDTAALLRYIYVRANSQSNLLTKSFRIWSVLCVKEGDDCICKTNSLWMGSHRHAPPIDAKKGSCSIAAVSNAVAA